MAILVVGRGSESKQLGMIFFLLIMADNFIEKGFYLDVYEPIDS